MAQILIADTAALDRIAKLETKLALAMAVVEAAKVIVENATDTLRFSGGKSYLECWDVTPKDMDALMKALAGLEE